MANTIQEEQKNSADGNVKSEEVNTSQENTKSHLQQEESHALESKNTNEVPKIAETDEKTEVTEKMESKTEADNPIESKSQADAQVLSNDVVNNEVEQNNVEVKADEKVFLQTDGEVDGDMKNNTHDNSQHNEANNDNEVDDYNDGLLNHGDGCVQENDNDDNVHHQNDGDGGVHENDDGDNADNDVGGGDGDGDNGGDDDDDADDDDDVDDEDEEDDDIQEEIEQDGKLKNEVGNKEDDLEDEELEEEEEEVDNQPTPEPKHETKVEKQLDHDQDRRNPQYIPKGGAFYEHDNRTSSEDVKSKDAQDADKKKKVWKESKKSERWSHDCYNEFEQQPKTKAEIMETYGYDIRNEEAPPRARRRRKYGRGPDKYDRNWEDEQAYMVKQNVVGRRGKKKSFGKEEFPPLPNHKNETNTEKASSKSQDWKKEEDLIKRSVRVNNHEKSSGSPHQTRNEYSSNRYSSGGNQSVGSNKVNFSQNRKIIKEDIKPFRQFDKTKWKSSNFKRGKVEEVFRGNKLKQTNKEEAQTPRSIESSRNYSGDSEIAHITEGFSQMTFSNKLSSIRENRQDANEINEQEMDNSVNRLNPKRYSKNRKGFTGFFPPEEIAEIDPVEMKQLQQEQQQKSQHVSLQQQPLNIQNIIRRYPGAYNGNPGYIAPRPIITGIPQQGMNPQGLQQALSPQGIPQQALSPQVPGLQAIELQQSPIPPQTNFVPQIYMDPHYRASEIMGPYTSFTPYSANQPSEMYQPSGGITYYNTECQNSNQFRAPPARRQKTAIPILPPPK